MRTSTYRSLTGFIFLVMGMLHLIRVIYGWSAVIAGWEVPLWVSWVIVVVAAILVYFAFNKENSL